MNVRDVFLCECGSEGLVIEPDEEDKQIYVSLYDRMYQTASKSIFERLRWCWHVLRTGEPWTDSIILDYETANRLADSLYRIVHKPV